MDYRASLAMTERGGAGDDGAGGGSQWTERAAAGNDESGLPRFARNDELGRGSQLRSAGRLGIRKLGRAGRP